MIRVAFSTLLHEDTITDDNPMIFDVVLLNIGDGYDKLTGKFRHTVHNQKMIIVVNQV